MISLYSHNGFILKWSLLVSGCLPLLVACVMAE